MEHDHRPLFRRQLAEGVVEVVSSGDGARHVRRGGQIGLEEADAGHVTAFAAGFGVAGMDDQAVQPGVEALDVAERRQVAPRPEQRLLGRVLGAMRIAQDPVGEGVAAVDARRDQGREGVPVAVLARSTSSACIVRSGCGGPSGRVTEYGAGPSRNVQSRSAAAPIEPVYVMPIAGCRGVRDAERSALERRLDTQRDVAGQRDADRAAITGRLGGRDEVLA